MSNKDIVQVAWRAFSDRPNENLHIASGNMTESVIREAMERKSTDNVTAVLIAFPNLERQMQPYYSTPQNRRGFKQNQEF